MTADHYTPDYFSSGLFEHNYQPLADAIVDAYGPARVLDVGCGPGKLSRALARRGVDVTAIDGFADPKFTEPNLHFERCNLNSAEALDAFEGTNQSGFDVAVCLEVAEHLDPSSSDRLVRFLCGRARVVVFSAAVPGQGGAGHINCQPRTAWHDRFTANGFSLAHRVRPAIISRADVAPWHRLNTLDYQRTDPSLPLPPVRDLLACESTLASAYYGACEEITRRGNLLNLPSVRTWLAFRARLKAWLRRS